MKTAELLNQLIRASKKLEEALGFENTEPYREATVQRFEYTGDDFLREINLLISRTS